MRIHNARNLTHTKMNTNHLTIEQAVELVKSSTGDVFSRDVVLSLLERINVQEKSNMGILRDILKNNRVSIEEYIETAIEDNWSDLVDYDDYELSLNGREIELYEVSKNRYSNVGRNCSFSIVDHLNECLDQVEAEDNVLAERDALVEQEVEVKQEEVRASTNME